MRRTQNGFTMIELLVASSVALLLFLLLAQLLNTTFKIQARENQNIPVQQALRASIEVMTTEIRSAVGPRVYYPNINGTGVSPSTSFPFSTSTAITILVPESNATFAIPIPAGATTNPTLTVRTSSIITDGTVTDPTVTPRTCASVFTGNDYGVFYSTATTSYAANALRPPGSFGLIYTSPTSVCVGSGSVLLNHPTTTLPATAWTANTYIVKVRPVTYYVSSNTLYRQIAGQAAQIVAFNISQLAFTYLPEVSSATLPNCTSTTTYFTTATCAPRNITVTLTSTPQVTSVSGAQPLTASQTIFLR